MIFLLTRVNCRVSLPLRLRIYLWFLYICWLLLISFIQILFILWRFWVLCPCLAGVGEAQSPVRNFYLICVFYVAIGILKLGLTPVILIVFFNIRIFYLYKFCVFFSLRVIGWFYIYTVSLFWSFIFINIYISIYLLTICLTLSSKELLFPRTVANTPRPYFWILVSDRYCWWCVLPVFCPFL